jgi:excisionase family DNA binding protein
MRAESRPGRGGSPETAVSASGCNSTPSPPKEWMHHGELADWLGVDPKTLYWERYQGRLAAYRVGRGLLYHRDQIMAWLESCRTVQP